MPSPTDPLADGIAPDGVAPVDAGWQPQPTLAYQPLHAVAAWQQTELRRLLRYLSVHSPYYRQRFADAGVTPNTPLHAHPLTTKTDLAQHNEAFFCVPRTQLVDYTSTSGTLGEPVTVPLTDTDLDRLAYNEATAFTCANHQPSDLYQLCTTIDRRFMAGMAYFLGARRLGAGILRIGPGSEAAHWASILRWQPTVLIVVPSFLLRLLAYAEHAGIAWQDTAVRRAICIGEAIRNPDFSLNALGERIAAQWPIQLCSTYGATELQTACTECSAGMGGHIPPDLVIAEVLDETGQPVPDGAVGELTVTTLGVQGLPLLRYQTGDLCQLHRQPCACGRTSPRLGPILSRKQHMVKVAGTTLYPAMVSEVLHRLPQVHSHIVEMYSTPLGTDALRIRIALQGNGLQQPADEKMVSEALRSHLRVLPPVIFESVATVAALQRPTDSRKPRTVIDYRPATAP